MTQLALITGGAVRIGKAIALRLAKAGFSVAIQYRNSREEAGATVAAIEAAGGKAACFKADLAQHADVESLIPKVKATIGCVTCLINNASYFGDDAAQTLTDESWRAHLAINLKAPVFLAQAFAAQLPAAKTAISSTLSISASFAPIRSISPTR